MPSWTKAELGKIEKTDELDLRSLRSDGTLRNPVTMWVVRIGDDLYVRAYKGPTSPWYRGVLTRHEGRISSGGVEKEVTFVEQTDPELIEKVSQAFLSKYRSYDPQWVRPMVTPEARQATLKLVPQ